MWLRDRVRINPLTLTPNLGTVQFFFYQHINSKLTKKQLAGYVPNPFLFTVEEEKDEQTSSEFYKMLLGPAAFKHIPQSGRKNPLMER